MFLVLALDNLSRRGDPFALHCSTSQYGLQSIHYSGVQLWTSLPVDIRKIQFLSPFFILKLNYIFCQIIGQLDTYIYIYIVYRILINVLICEILQTIMFFFHFVLNVLLLLVPFSFLFPTF